MSVPMCIYHGVRMTYEQMAMLNAYVGADDYYVLNDVYETLQDGYDEMDGWVSLDPHYKRLLTYGLTVYRGVSDDASGSEVLGPSWTASKRVAKWHALRFAGASGTIYTWHMTGKQIRDYLIFANLDAPEAEMILFREAICCDGNHIMPKVSSEVVINDGVLLGDINIYVKGDNWARRPN